MTQDPADNPGPDDGAARGLDALQHAIEDPRIRSQLPPGLTAATRAAANGHRPGSGSYSQQTAQNTAQAAALLAQLPQAIGAMLAQVVKSIPRPPLCSTCLIARLKWEAQYMPQLEAAITAAAEAAGIPDGDPRRGLIDAASYLPEHLQPGAGSQGMPPVNPKNTTIGGTDYCSGHIPGLAGGRTLLVAQGALSSSLLAQYSG
jgi:hypothetical protein